MSLPKTHKSFNELILTASEEDINDLRNTVSEMGNFLKLDIPIVENIKAQKPSLQYLNQHVELNSTTTKEIERFFNLLLRINPKNGKICTCSDCKLCPSKRKSFDDFNVKNRRLITTGR